MRYSLLLLCLVGCATAQGTAPTSVVSPAAGSDVPPPDMVLTRAADEAPHCFVTDTQRTVCPNRGKALPFSDAPPQDATAAIASEPARPGPPPCVGNSAAGVQCPPSGAGPVAEDAPQGP